MLFGPLTPNHHPIHAPTTVAPAAPISGPSRPNPAPEMWSAILASARRRRTSCTWPPSDVPAVSAEDLSSTLVAIYLIPPEVRQRARVAARLAEEARR
ncbi:hypothetical protein ACKI2C_43800 [Streptomyces brasiliscabiei]|uniref:hypothetical protein n=1 Tax=Streptomyces brasiliscabiei TaxID=2736302 RepID=UPI0038F808AD